MKKLIVSVLIVCVVLGMLASFVPASASYQRNLPQADFDWYINHQGRLVLDATWSTGNIQKYRWEIWEECEWCDYSDWPVVKLVRRRSSIYKTRLPSGKYLVTLTVYDCQGRKDSIYRLVKIPEPEPEPVCRVRPRVSVEFKLTREEAKTVAKVLFWTGVLIYIFGGSN